MRWSLRSRFLVPVVALVVCGLGITVAINYVYSKKALSETLEREIGLTAAATAGFLDSWLGDRRMEATILSREKLFVVSAQDSHHSEYARRSAIEKLSGMLKDFKYYENICIASPDGQIVAAADPAVVGTINVKERPYFQQALKGQEAVSSVIKSKGSGNPVFVVAVPLAEEDGSVVGVFFTVVDVQAFSTRFIDNIKIGQSGYAYLFGADGLVIAHPDHANIMTLNLNEYEFGRRMLGRQNGLVAYEFKGVEMLAAFKRCEKIGWTVAVGALRQELLAPVNSLAFVNLVVAAAVVLSAAVLVLLMVRSTVTPINTMVTELIDSAGQVARGSSEVSASSQQLAEGATRQAASIEETSSSLEEMAAMTRQNAENANQARSMMASAGQLVEDVNQKMTQMVQAIAEITQTSQETGKIIKTIDEIAFQTNLLALNAAVEAARAGEAGAGFAVVADEVRNLAMRAAEAAKNTSQLIDNTLRAVHNGNGLTLSTQSAFGQNLEITRKAGDLVQEIAAASSEQAQGIQQITAAVGEMDKVVQQVAAGAEESASASEQMSAQAQHMSQIVGALVGLINGRRKGGGSTAASKKHPGPPVPRFAPTQLAAAPAPVRGGDSAAVDPETLIALKDRDFKDF